ncbi:hypothetical protein KI387_036226, partial [Taxus chinensis]
RLDPTSLALHYANIVNQIGSLVSRPNSVPLNTRDTLYRGLPPSIRLALRSKLLSNPVKEELTVPQIKAEMEKILMWLVLVVTNTTKAHHGFGWVGEWANTGSTLDRRLPGHSDFTLIQTFHYAEKEKTEAYIFKLIVWLHHLVNKARNSANGSKPPIKSHVHSLVPTNSNPSGLFPNKLTSIRNDNAPSLRELSQEDKDMLKDERFVPISDEKYFSSFLEKYSKQKMIRERNCFILCTGVANAFKAEKLLLYQNIRTITFVKMIKSFVRIMHGIIVMPLVSFATHKEPMFQIVPEIHVNNVRFTSSKYIAGTLLKAPNSIESLTQAIEVLDTLGTNMTSLNLSSGFASGATSKGNKI